MEIIMQWFYDMRVGKKLIISFLIMACLTGFIGYLGIINMSNMNDLASSMYSRELMGVSHIKDANANLIYIDRASRNLLLASSTEERQKYLERIDKYKKDYVDFFEKARPLFWTEKGKAAISNIAKTWEEYIPVLAQLIELNKKEDISNKRESATLALGLLRDKIDAVDVALDEASNIKEDTAHKFANQILDTYQTSKYTLLGIIFGSILLGIILGIFISRSISKPLNATMIFAESVAKGNLDDTCAVSSRDEVGQLAESLRHMVGKLKEKIEEAFQKSQLAEQQTERAQSAMGEAEQAQKHAESKAEEILAAAKQLESIVEIVTSASEQLSAQIEQSSRGAEEQAHRIGETATSMEEMNATVLEVARNASSAASTADQAKVKAEEGSTVVGQVVKGIEQVQHQSQEMKNDMGNLGKQAEGIGQILNVISDIADQTNLLALNAAIEAARAGEAGRGFAVVADEVRKLAEKTMTATKEVGQAIRGIQDGTKKNIDNVERSATTIEDVTKLANTSGESLRQIVSLAEVTTDQVRSIATASEEQSSASEEINRSIEDVNRVSLETSEAMRQSAQAVGELAHQAQILKTLIADMRSDNGSNPATLPSGKKRLALGRA
jgi:methyl-accepting chemotaxis protein